MKYITSKVAADKWHLTERTIRNYCANGKIKGSFLNGKTWMIPENAIINKTATTNQSSLLLSLVNFLDGSPVNYFAIKNASTTLVDNGFTELTENHIHTFEKGNKVFITRNNSSLVAISIGNNVSKENTSFHIIASHSDSPTFKIKPNPESTSGSYNKINVEPYGGMICSSWLDRPLGIAGRVLIKEDNKIVSKLLNIDEDVAMIPNLCIHFNRDINAGHNYNMAVDMQPFFAEGLKEKPFTSYIAERLDVKAENIINFDLSLVNREKATIWGLKGEYISSPRLDDLECVFTSLKAFIDSNNENTINVLYIADNEEVGSSSRQGADSDFLENTLVKVAKSLNMSELEFNKALAASFLVSADNAHAVHPNFPGTTDSGNCCYMNKGIAIKFNASQRYTTDAISSAIFQEICKSVNTPYQYFANRSDMRGGSTLGNILINHVSLLSVDVGLPQLAMHSAFETAGSEDVSYAYQAFKKFYESSFIFDKDTYEIY